MRRIYDSDALRKDDGHFTPKSADRRSIVPRAHRWIPSRSLTNWIIPMWIRRKAISVHIKTPQQTYKSGQRIPIRVTLKNAMPFPISIPTASPIVWNWFVDDYPEAATVDIRNLDDDSGMIVFDRGERKEFTKYWNQLFRTSPTKWEPVPPGTYTLAAGISVTNPQAEGLWAETEISIVE